MGPIVCVGAALVDDSFRCLADPVPGTSNPARHTRSPGGVARNVAHHLAQLGHSVELLAHFGEDPDGSWLASVCRRAGIGLGQAHLSDAPTGHFAAIVSPDGELYAAAADTGSEEHLTAAFLRAKAPAIERAPLLLLDCNLSAEAMEWLLAFCRDRAIPCVIEPVSAPKAGRLDHVSLEGTLLITPNSLELAALSAAADESSSIEHLLARGVRSVWMRKGSLGSLLVSREGTITLPAPRVRVVDATGAGDAALAGWMHAWLFGKPLRECLLYGHAMAEIILQTQGSVSPSLHPELLETAVSRQETYAP
jgi:pseudouridine kinase